MTVLRDVPADPALPDLATVLDETAMRAILSEAIQAGGGAPLERCTITWIKYKPGKSCTVAPELAGWASSRLGATTTRWSLLSCTSSTRSAAAGRWKSTSYSCSPAAVSSSVMIQ